MIIDAHYHLDERIETVDRLVDQMEKHKIDKIALIGTMVDPFKVVGMAEILGNIMRSTQPVRCNANIFATRLQRQVYIF